MAKKRKGKKRGSGWGGRRRGAGRPTDELRAELRAAQANLAGQILGNVDGTAEAELKAWSRFLNHKDPNLALRARMYLTDLRTPPPKPGEAAHAGNVTLVFNGPRPKWAPPATAEPQVSG